MEVLKTTSTENKLRYLQETKSQIKDAITTMGQPVEDTDTFRSYPQKILDIQSVNPEEIEKLSQRIDEVAGDVETNKTSIDTINQELESKLESEDLEEINTNVSTNTTNIEKNTNDITTINKKIEGLTTDKADVSQVTALEEKQSETETELTNFKSEYDAEVLKTNSKIDEVKNTLETSIGETNTKVDEKYQELNNKITTNQQAIENNKVEADNAIALINSTLINKFEKEDAKPLIKSIEYDNETCKFAFTSVDGTKKEVDLPLESTVKSGRYDDATKALILVLQSGDEISIPATSLIDIYTGSVGDKINITVDFDKVISATIKTASIEKTDLTTELQNEINGKANSSDLYTGNLYTNLSVKDEADKQGFTINYGSKSFSEGKPQTSNPAESYTLKFDNTTGLVLSSDVSSRTLKIQANAIPFTSGDSGLSSNKMEDAIKEVNSKINQSSSELTTLQETVESNKTEVDEALAGKLSMKDLGDKLLESAKVTSSGTLVPKIFSDLQFSHKYRLMLPYITIDATGKVNTGFQDILSNSSVDENENPITIEFKKDDLDDDISIVAKLDESKLQAAGKVNTVNSIEPDESKNIVLKAENIPYDNTVFTPDQFESAEDVQNQLDTLTDQVNNILLQYNDLTSGFSILTNLMSFIWDLDQYYNVEEGERQELFEEYKNMMANTNFYSATTPDDNIILVGTMSKSTDTNSFNNALEEGLQSCSTGYDLLKHLVEGNYLTLIGIPEQYAETSGAATEGDAYMLFPATNMNDIWGYLAQGNDPTSIVKYEVSDGGKKVAESQNITAKTDGSNITQVDGVFLINATIGDDSGIIALIPLKFNDKSYLNDGTSVTCDFYLNGSKETSTGFDIKLNQEKSGVEEVDDLVYGKYILEEQQIV